MISLLVNEKLGVKYTFGTNGELSQLEKMAFHQEVVNGKVEQSFEPGNRNMYIIKTKTFGYVYVSAVVKHSLNDIMLLQIKQDKVKDVWVDVMKKWLWREAN